MKETVRQRREASLHAKRTSKLNLNSSLFIIELHLSSCQSEMSHSPPECECVTTGLAPDGVMNIDWESFTLRFQTLIAFQAFSLFDGEVLVWSVVNTDVVLSVSRSLLIQLWSSTSDHVFYRDSSWCELNLMCGKSDMINPYMSIYLFIVFGCFQGMGVPMCCLRLNAIVTKALPPCECQCDCHSFSLSLTWMNGQPGYHGNSSHWRTPSVQSY